MSAPINPDAHRNRCPKGLATYSLDELRSLSAAYSFLIAARQSVYNELKRGGEDVRRLARLNKQQVNDRAAALKIIAESKKRGVVLKNRKILSNGTN